MTPNEKEFMEDKQPEFAFQKKIGINQCMYGDISHISNIIERLMVCMMESNKFNEVECQFFRLDFRQPYFDEQMQFPYGSLILDMKWGSKEELIKVKNLPNHKEVGFKYRFEEVKPNLLINGINFSKEEIEDLLSNLHQCESEGYLNYGNPAFTAMQKLISLQNDTD